MPGNPEWDRYAISAELRRRGLTLAGLSRSFGLERTACSVALLRRHRPGEAAIATALGVEPNVLWPERYRAEQPQHRRRRRRRTSRNRHAL